METTKYIVDAGGGVVYIAETNPGSGNTTAKAAWRIKKITTSGGVTNIQWASGNPNFDKIADNYATYSYA